MPKYRDIYKKIKDDIAYGEYRPGTLLPTEPELEQLFNCSRTTIRKAISMLENEGYLDVKQGRGTTVQDIKSVQNLNKITSITETLRLHGYNVTVPAMNIEPIQASGRIASQLGLLENDTVYKVERVIYIDNIPISIMTNYLTAEIFPELERYNNQFISLYKFLEDTYGITLTDANERITARISDFTQSQILRISTGTPLLFIRRTSSCDKGIFEYCEIYIIADRYEYEIYLSGR